jgi:hypothetical protein
MKPWLATLQSCDEPRNVRFALLVDQEVEYAEGSSGVRIAVIRVRTWSVCHAQRVRTGKIGWQYGKTYELRSKTVKLSQHLGHKVTITGTLRAESAEKEKGEAEEHENKEAAEAGDISVTDLKMVSDKCQ